MATILDRSVPPLWKVLMNCAALEGKWRREFWVSSMYQETAEPMETSLGMTSTDIFGEDKSQLKLHESWHAAVKFQPIIFWFVSEGQQITAHLFSMMISFGFHFRGASIREYWARISQGLPSTSTDKNASGFLQLVKCLFISGPAGWSFSRPQQWGISLPLVSNLLNSVCPVRSRDWKAVRLHGWEGQEESNISTIIMFAFIKSTFIKTN